MDGLRLAIGTLTALPVRPPKTVDARTARWAVLLSPLAALPLGLAAAGTLWLGHRLGLASPAVGLLAIGVLALGTRAFHLDGLADTADGLTASYDRDRSLAVMKSGSVGPAGAAALIVILGLQAVGFAGLVSHPLAAGLLVCASRSVLRLTCMRGVPAAEGDGLRAPFAGCVSWPLGVVTWAVGATVVTVALILLGLPASRTAAGFVAATVLVVLLLRRAVGRLGGVTGDIFGASIELTLAVLLTSV